MTAGEPPIDPRLARALAHPLRARLLMAYGGRVVSPSQVAEELGARMGDVAYHTRQLVAYGCLEHVETVPGRRGRKHLYRATRTLEVGDEEWEGLPEVVRTQALGPVLDAVVEDIAGLRAVPAPAADTPHVARVRLQLDEPARIRLATLLAQLLGDVERLQRESDQRGATAPPTALALLHVPRAASRG